MAYLVSVGSKHGSEGQADLVDGESWGPATIPTIIQYVKADVAIAINVWVHWAGRHKDNLHITEHGPAWHNKDASLLHVLTLHYLRRLKWVVICELYLYPAAAHMRFYHTGQHTGQHLCV